MMCNSLRLTVVALGLVSFSAWAQPGLGVPAVYFDRDDNLLSMPPFPNSQAKFNDFTAALRTYGVDTIEGTNTVDPPFGFDPALVFGATGITASTQSTTSAVAAPFPGFSIGAKMLVENDALALFDPSAPQFPASPTIFNFNQHITAFGLYVIQGGDEGVPPSPTNNNNPTTFRLTDTVANTSVDVPVQIGPGWGFNNVFFLGLTDTVPFNQVSILESADVTDGMTYDNLVAGFVVPEPGSLALVILGGACALCRRARFRRGSSSLDR